VAGELIVTSEPPGAKVRVDDRQLGRTPVRLEGLRPAQVRVRVSSPGHLGFDQTVTVSAEGATTVNARLVPAPPREIRFSLSPVLVIRAGTPRLVDRWSTHYQGSANQYQVLSTCTLDAHLEGTYSGPSSVTGAGISAQAHITDRLGVGFAMQSLSDDLADDVAFGYTVVRQWSYYSSRGASTVTSEASGTATGFARRQRMFHLMATWGVPVTQRLTLELSAGPSVFSVSQQVMRDIVGLVHCAETEGEYSSHLKRAGCSVDYTGYTEHRNRLGVNAGALVLLRLDRRLSLLAGLRVTTAGTISVKGTSMASQLEPVNNLWPDFYYEVPATWTEIKVKTGIVEPHFGLRYTF
jgi:hypothetical protein